MYFYLCTVHRALIDQPFWTRLPGLEWEFANLDFYGSQNVSHRECSLGYCCSRVVWTSKRFVFFLTFLSFLSSHLRLFRFLFFFCSDSSPLMISVINFSYNLSYNFRCSVIIFAVLVRQMRRHRSWPMKRCMYGVAWRRTSRLFYRHMLKRGYVN